MSCLNFNENIKNKYRCIIVGGGLGGLTMAGMLALYGIEVLLVEKNHNLGGYLSDYKVGEYTFSHSIDWMSGLHEKGKVRILLEKLNLMDKVEIFPLESFKRVITPDYNIPFHSDFEKFEETLISNFPHEERGIRDFVRLLRSFGGPEWINYFRPHKNDEYLPFLQKFFSDQKLIAVLSANVNGNIPAYLFVLFLYRCLSRQAYLLQNMNLTQFIDLIGERLIEMGVSIAVNSEVVELPVKGNRVTGVKLANGNFIEADAVITDIDLKTVYNKYLEQGTVNNYFLNKLNCREECFSLVSVFLGVNQDFTKCGITGEPTVYVPTYELDDLYADDPKLWHLKVNTRSIWQPFLAPQGKSAIDIRALVRKDLFKPWLEDKNYRTNPQYQSLKAKITEAFLENSQNILGSYTGNIEMQRVASPITLKRYTYSSGGSAMGWEVTPLEYLNGFRIMSPLDNLFHVGGWASYPGVEGVVNYSLSLTPRIVKFFTK